MKNCVGLGLRHSFHDYVIQNKPDVPWFEVITENYLLFDGKPRRFLHEIREDYPLVFHGVSLSIGSLEPVRQDYLSQLKKLTAEFKPEWISDHLCWTYNGAENSHDLLPVPFTRESLQRIIRKVQQVQEFLGQKIYLENPSAYVDFSRNEYLEEDFIAELCKATDCGLLLDLNNLVVNQYNLGYQPLNYLQKIKNCDVKQIHLAGHSIADQVRIDTHDSEISQEVFDLLPVAKGLWPDANPMIEWDDKIPEIGYLLELRKKVSHIWTAAAELPATATDSYPAESRNFNDHEIHSHFWSLLKSSEYITEEDIAEKKMFRVDCPTPAHVGMNVYSSAYFARILEVLENDFPVLKSVLDELFPDVMLAYLEKYPSTYDSIDFIGNNLAKFIAENEFPYSLGVDKRIISDVAAFESLSGLCSVAFTDSLPPLQVKKFSEADWTGRQLRLRTGIFLYRAHCEIHPVIEAVKSQEIPVIPELQARYYMFYQEEACSHFKLLTEDEFYFFNKFFEPQTFVDALSEDAGNLEQTSQLLFRNESFFVTIPAVGPL